MHTNQKIGCAILAFMVIITVAFVAFISNAYRDDLRRFPTEAPFELENNPVTYINVSFG